MASLVYAAVLKHYSTQGFTRYSPATPVEGPAEDAIKHEFLQDGVSDEARYQALFDYFLAGALRYTDAAGSRIQYPGAAGNSGYSVNGLEGFARTGILFAAWVASGRNTSVFDASSGRSIDLVAYLRRALLTGTDPGSAGYWGGIRDLDQRGVEAADVARIIWLTRGRIWDRLDVSQQNRLVHWLRQVDGRKTPDTVWLLFPFTVDLVLRSLGAGGTDLPSLANYRRFKQNYLGNGWFSDPPNGVDFYNTWGMSYELFWIALIDPGFDREFIRSALSQSADLTAHLIAPDGVPLMGRSVCYRTAVAVPLLAQQALENQGHDPPTEGAGLARRALDRVWRHFIAHGALQDGALTQGYYRADLRFVDYYTGSGSCHWGLRSLVLALMQPPDAALWRAREQPLPVERGDYRLVYGNLGWIVSGDHASGRVVIEIPANAGNTPQILPYSAWRRWLEPLFQRPFRPSNEAVQYGRPLYASDAPLVGE